MSGISTWPAAKDQASKPVCVFKKVDRSSVRPVIFSGQFTGSTGKNKNDGEEPDIGPFDFSGHDFNLRDTFAAEVGDHPAKHNENGKIQGVLKRKKR